jgi:hypothetical protein
MWLVAGTVMLFDHHRSDRFGLVFVLMGAAFVLLGGSEKLWEGSAVRWITRLLALLLLGASIGLGLRGL